jgi:hypothetical protein
VSFYYANDGDPGWPEKLEVKWGTAPNAAGMTGGQIFDDPNIYGPFHHGVGTFSVPVHDVYYVGFHGYSNADMDILSVDDINITEVIISDLGIKANNTQHCDTLGWVNPPITFRNLGSSTLPVGDTLYGAYKINNGIWIKDTFVLINPLIPGNSQTFNFSTPYHFNQPTTYNCKYAVNYYADQNPNNDTVAFTLGFGFIQVNLGPDSTVCDDNMMMLNAGHGFDSYLWSTGDTTDVITFDSTGYGPGPHTFWVEVMQDTCTDLSTVVITFDICTGISEQPVASCGIHPNPSTGIFKLDISGFTGNVFLSVMNLQGQTVYMENLIVTNAILLEQLDLATLPKGVYFMRLMNDNRQLVKKLVIE